MLVRAIVDETAYESIHLERCYCLPSNRSNFRHAPSPSTNRESPARWFSGAVVPVTGNSRFSHSHNDNYELPNPGKTESGKFGLGACLGAIASVRNLKNYICTFHVNMKQPQYDCHIYAERKSILPGRVCRVLHGPNGIYCRSTITTILKDPVELKGQL